MNNQSQWSRLVVLVVVSLLLILVNGQAGLLAQPTAYDFKRDANDNVYYVTQGSNIVTKIMADGSPDKIYYATQGLSAGIAVDGQGKIYLSTGTSIEKIDPSVSDSAVVLYEGSLLQSAYGLDVDQQGNVYVASSGNSAIIKITSSGVASVLASGSPLEYPVNVLIDTDGQLLVSDYSFSTYGYGRVLKVFQCGAIQTVVDDNFVKSPWGLVRTKSGNLYVSSAWGDKLVRITPDGTIAFYQENDPNYAFSQAVGMALTSTGKLYVAQYTNGYREVTLPEEPIDPGTQSLTNVGAAYYSGSVFKEDSLTNSGHIFTTQTIKLVCNEKFANTDTLRPGIHYNATGVPMGLTLVITKLSDSTAKIAFLGNAIANAKADSAIVSVNFLNPAVQSGNGSLVSGLNPGKLFIKFLDPNVASYSNKTFYEDSVSNNGAVITKQTVTLTGNTFTATPGTVLTPGADFNTNNIPSGLDLQITITEVNTAEINFTGNATNHAAIDSATVTVTFTDNAIANGSASVVQNFSPVQLKLRFFDPATAKYSDSLFVEAGANDGSVSTTRTITLVGTQWNSAITDGSPFSDGVHFSSSNVPAGLTLVVTKNSSNQATIGFIGNASANQVADSANNVQIAFTDAALNGAGAANVVGLNGVNLSIKYFDPATAVYSDSTFLEAMPANNGSIATTRMITLTGAQWNNSVPNGTAFNASQFMAANVPAGLILVVTKVSASQANISFTGNAQNHFTSNSVNNIQITFTDAALNGAVAASVIGLNEVNLYAFFQGGQCGEVTTFAGNGQNTSVDGQGGFASFADARDIQTDADGNIYIGDGTTIRKISPNGSVSTILSGVSSVGDIYGITLDASKNIYFTEIGSNSIRKLTPSGVLTTIAGGTGIGSDDGPVATAKFNWPHDVAVDAFGNLYVADYNNNAIRKISNGIVSTLTDQIPNGPVNIVIDKKNNLFVAGYVSSNIYKVTQSGEVSVFANLSGEQVVGLTIDSQDNMYTANYYPDPKVLKISPSAEITTIAGSGEQGYLDGMSTDAHFNLPWGVAMDPSGNLFISDRANYRIRAINVCGASSKLPIAALYSGTVFNEAAANIGSISTTQTITLGSAQWASSVANGATFAPGTHFTVANVPAGLTLIVTKVDSSHAVISFAGNAAAHQAADSVNNVQITFLNAALNGGIAASVVENLNGTSLSIRYLNAPLQVSAVYSTTAFVEAIANDGSISTNILVSLKNDTFLPNGAFVQGTHFNVTGVPAGLTLHVTKVSSTQAQLSFTGNATAHKNINDTSATLTFLNAAVASGNAAGAIGLTPKTLTIDFSDNPLASYSGISFVESVANDGTVSTTRTITLSASQWNSSIANGTSLISGTHFTASNVPAGLTAVVTKVNASQATISFSGSAAQHTALASVNNVQVTFTNTALNNLAASAVAGLNGVNLSIVFTGQDCNTVTTFAGSGTIASVDGVGTAASFIDPYAVTTDKSGNVYIADGTKIRKITPAGVVSTFVGSGAGLSAMNGIAIDRNGNLFVIEQTLIRRITPAGAVATVPITGATIPNGSDIAVDAFGNLYVSDGIASIYKITSNGVAKRLNTQDVIAAGIAVDAQGNVYCGGYNTNKVFKVALNGTVTTVAGSGVAGYADGTGTSAQFNQPVGITLDASGNLYVMDYVGSRIRKITPNGVVSTIAGSGTIGYADGVGTTAQFNYPLHIALDTLGNLFVTDRLNYRIRAINVCGASGALPGAAAYSGTTFLEATSNNGSVSTTQTITLGAASWASTIANGTAFTAGTHFSAVNVPPGLTAVVTKVSSTQAIISFTGNATNHQSANNVSNVQLTFTDAALNSSASASVQGLNGVNLSITFRDNASAFYSGTSFTESLANDGTVSTTRTITLAFDTFVPTGIFTPNTHYTATGVPAGLTMTITRTSQTVAQIAFTGTAAAHENINDATIALTFLNAAVASGNAAAVTGLTPKTLTIDFADAPVLGTAVYSDSTFIESAINNGSVNTIRTVTLNGDSFVGVSTFVQGTHFTASGVPSGLTLTIARTSSSTAQLSFIGSALAHANANDAVVTLTFLNAALLSGNASGSIGLTPKRLFVDFADPTCGAVTTFAGNGNAAVVDGVGTLSSFVDPRDVVTDAAGNVYVADKTCIRKITPAGVVTTLAGSGTLSGFVNGTGTNARFGDIYGVGIDGFGNIFVADESNAAIRKITSAGVVSTVAGGNGSGSANGPAATASFYSPQDVAVDAFGNLYVADYGNGVIRKISNGIVSTLNTTPIPGGPINVVVDASGTVYVGGYGTNKIFKVTPVGTVSVVAGSGALGNANGTGASASFGQPVGVVLDTAGNLYVSDYYPYSLIRKITPAGVVTTIAGTGSPGYADGVSTNAAFNYPYGLAFDASGNLFIGDRFNQRIRSMYVCGAAGQFPLAASYSGTIFTESAANNGTITTTQTVTLGGTTWSGAIPDGGTFVPGTHYTVSDVPAGLTFSLVRNSPTTAQLYLTGVAAAHQNVNDTSFTLTFLNASVTNGNVSAVVGLTPKTFTIDFNDAPQGAFAAYSDSVFTETAANAGQVTTTRTVTLSGASFVTGAYTDGTHFTATGVPAGLTLTVTRLSATQARLAFTGTAAAHALANSTDVGLTFLPAVLTGGNVAGVVGLTPKTLRVNFLDPYTASYSDTTFAESIANDGTVPTVRTLTLVGVNFTTTATTLVQGTHFNVSGVPSGLTLTVTKTSSNVAQIAFSGAAAAHVVDVNNITLSFLNAALESGSGTAAAVVGLTPKKLSIDFIAPYSATYSAKNFVEGPANDGTVPTVRTLTLFGGDSFLPATLLQGAHFTATGVPSGLTMVMTRTSSTTAQISFTGTATNHANVNDASVSITFIPEALASGNPSAVVGLTPATLTIDFRDPDLTPPSSPNILGFTPQIGTTGTVVTISGFGFTGTQNVLFGGAPAKSLTVVSDSTITAVVDYGSTGDVTVVNAQGFAILPGFTYVPRPVISSFTPTTGNAGAVVTITGSNFQGMALNGTSWTTTSVYFGGTPATSFTVLSPTQIQATVGAGATGAVRVETLTGNVGVRNGFCYMAPLIAAFAPTSASTGTQVVITGSNFTGATAVKFNGKAAASFSVVSDTQITAFPATGTPLTGSISVTTPQCTDDLATFTFIPAPIIYGFWLSGGTDGDVITIDGVNFTGASGVKFGDMIAASYTVVSPTRIQAVVGSGNTGAVSVIGPGGVGSRSKFIYYAPGAGRPNPPIITSFTPTEGPDGTVVTINGLNFQGADWYTTAVRIGDAPDGPKTAIIQSMTATRLVVKVNGGATGLIRVYTPAGVTTSTQTFTYFPPPTISAFTPTTGGAGTTVTILGTEFTGVTSVKFGGVSATSFTVDSPTQITATVGTGNTGRVQVVASGGTATSSVNFTLPTPPPAPTVTTFSPAIATTGTVITINGSNFTGATQVTFGGTPAQSFTVVNASRITAVVGGGASGSVAVTTPSGSASKTGFTYLPKPLPTITSFAPASASPGQTVTILGTYFTGATQVFMGSASVPFTVIHSGKITVEVPTNAASGVIRVVTPDGVAMRSGFTFIPLVAMLNNFGGVQLTSAPPSESLILAERSETEESVSLGVYPNPATDVVTLTATGFGDGRVVSVTLLNTLGQTILSLNKESIGGNLQTRVDVRELASGAYTAVLSDGVLRHVVRFVKR